MNVLFCVSANPLLQEQSVSEELLVSRCNIGDCSGRI